MCDRGSDTNLAGREQKKARQAFVGFRITSSKHETAAESVAPKLEQDLCGALEEQRVKSALVVAYANELKTNAYLEVLEKLLSEGK